MNLLILATAASAVTLTVDGECPGPVTITIGDLTPGAEVGVLTGLVPGDDLLPAGPCAGDETGLGGIRLRTRLRDEDRDGEIRLRPSLGPAACTSVLQVLELGTCELSATVDLDGPGDPVDGEILDEWTPFDFVDNGHRDDCAGGEKWVRSSARVGHEDMYVGATLCSPTTYKLWLSDSLDGTFTAMGDQCGYGQDHCFHVPGGFDDGIDWDTEPQTDWQGWQSCADDSIMVFQFFDSNAWVPRDYDCGVSIP